MKPYTLFPEEMDGKDDHSRSLIEKLLESVTGDSSRGSRIYTITEREKMLGDIKLEVSRRLEAMDPEEQSWLSELRELNHSQDSDVDFISRLLLQYKCDGPWVLHEDFLKQLICHHKESATLIEGVLFSPSLHKARCGHNGLSQLIHYADEAGSQSSDTPWSFDLDAKAEFISECDSILGIAGLVPLLWQHDDIHAVGTLGESWQFSLLHDICLKELKDHITVEPGGQNTLRSCAQVSYSSRDKSVRNNPVLDVVGHISHALHGINIVLAKLQALDLSCNGITFLRYTNALKPNSLDKSSVAVETVFLGFNLIQKLLIQFQACKKCFVDLPESQPRAPDGKALGVGFFAPMASLLTVATHLPVVVGVPTAAVGSAYLAIVSRNYYFRCYQASSSLRHAVHEILELVGVSPFHSGINADLSVMELAHYVSLTAQFISLVIQSFLRAAIGDIDFVHLDHPILDVILEGATSTTPRDSIFVTSQRLSCLGDMLGGQALVFGKAPGPSDIPLDVYATVIELIDLWGPAELVINSKNPIDALGQVEVAGIKIRGGVIERATQKESQQPLWHWKAIDHGYGMESKLKSMTSKTSVAINERTRLCVGATHHFCIVGPATMNDTCPHSNCRSDLEFRQNLHHYISDLGTQPSTWNLRSLQAGIQAGQYAVSQLLWTWEKYPGISVKSSLLQFNTAFDLWIPYLDKGYGLFVSLCTGVMTRVRLRDIIAFVGSRWMKDLIPNVSVRASSNSNQDFIEVLEGSTNLCDWVKSVEPDEQKVLLQAQIMHLARKVLETLKYTGVDPENDFVIGWMSEGHSVGKFSLPCRDYEWTRVLADSPYVATFACIAPNCFEAPGFKCRGQTWVHPNAFLLSTRVGQYRKLYSGRHISQLSTLKVGKSYWINSEELNLMATVVNNLDATPGYYLRVKRRILPPNILKYIGIKETIREENSPTATNCVIGS